MCGRIYKLKANCMVSNQAQMEPTNPDSAIDNEILNNSIDTSKIDHVEVIENVISTLDRKSVV